MVLRFLDRKIRESFSKAALEYDVLTSLHKEIGRELSQKVIHQDEVQSIVDIGMGTGWLTHRLSFYCPDTTIVGLDFAPGMTTVAKEKWPDLDILQATASQLPFADQSVDHVISNLAYQWVPDLDQAFLETNRILKEKGKLSVTMFGFETFKELFESLNQANSLKQDLPLRRLATAASITQIFQDLPFENFKVRQEFIKVRFPSMLGLLKWIKQIGANVLTPKTFIGKQWLDAAEHYYQTHFKDHLGIYATFEVVWIEAEK